MSNFLKYSFVIKILFLIVTSILFLLSFNNYNGEKYLYLFFTISFSIFFLDSFNKEKIKFFEFFLSIFLWLGFFFKYFICTKIINIFPEGVGSFDFSPDSFDEVMIISSIGVWGFFFGYYLVPKKIFKINYNLKYLENFYLNKSTFIIYFISSLIIFFSIINFSFGIFQKGFVSNQLFGNLFRNWIAFMFMIGFSTIVAFIINFELNRKKFNIIYLSLLETFFISFSTLSRAMIFNFFPFLIGYICKIDKIKFLKFDIKKIFKFILIFLLLFIFSVVVTSHLRTLKNIFNTHNSNLEKFDNIIVNSNLKKENLLELKKISSSNQNIKINKIENSKKIIFFDHINDYLKTFINIVTYRFIGIEGVMSVQSKSNKNFHLYLESLKETYKENTVSYYDKKFLGKTSSYTDSILIIQNQHAITLPGFIAHSFYSGSYLYVFFSAIIISIFCNLVIIITKNLYNNLIFTAFIGNLLSYRIIHWGYAPLNTYKLILGILISVVSIIIINYAIKKFYFKK